MDIIVAVQKHLNSLSVMNGTPLERRRKLLVAFLQQGLILAIIAWGSYIRLFALGEPSFWIDEAFSIELAHSIAQTDNWFSLKDSDGDWLRGPIYHNLLAVVIQFFGESEASTRWPSVLAGILLMVVLAFFCWQYIQPRVAVIAVLLLSTGYWQIAWSRQAREYMLLTLVIWFVFYLIQVFWKGSSQKTLKAISILLLTVVAGCIHLFGLIIIVAVLIRWLVDQFFSAEPRSGWFIWFIIIIATGGTVYLLRMMFGTEHFSLNVYAGFLIKTYWVLFPACAFAWYGTDNIEQRKMLLWLGLTTLFGLVIIGCAVPLVNPRYVFFLTPVFFIFTALGLDSLTKWGSKAYYFGLTTCLFAATFTSLLAWAPMTDYKLEAQDSSKEYRYFTPQPDFKSAYRYINSNLGKIDLVTPYPAISRRYRKIDDIAALDVSLDPLAEQKIREKYTDILFIRNDMLLQLAHQLGEIYLLMDSMSLHRVDPFIRQTILSDGRLVNTWNKSSTSSLYLYQIKH